MTKKKAAPKKAAPQEKGSSTEVVFFRFNYSVDFLVSVDGQPLNIMSTPPSAVMAADFDSHQIDIPGLLKQAQAQVAGQNDQQPVV